MAIPIIVGLCAVVFVGSWVVDRVRRRRRDERFAAQAELGFRAGPSSAISESEIRAIQEGGGLDRYPGGQV
ncbi:MAG: hypothetical protein ACXWCM_02320 [Acidimicrobiales bacterium]